LAQAFQFCSINLYRMNYKQPFFALLTIVNFCAACSQAANQRQMAAPATSDSAVVDTTTNTGTGEETYEPAGDSVRLPAITIELQLSPKAEQKLKTAKETVVVFASYSGVPRDTTLEQYKQWGRITVAEKQIELSEGRTARFDGIKISKKAYDGLVDKDVEVLVNVWSGRHSSPNNLLSVDMVQDAISKVQRQTQVLHGKLIDE
jgi:hypothetical protein